MPTFLFTDIEGSTRLWERHPAAMGRAIARQEGILRAAIGERGGTVFNTAGDGVCAVFPATDLAIYAAIEAQRILLQEPWESYAPGLKILVRMAVDAGDAEDSGGNFVGPVLNRLHRLMKTGHGGQILCTVAIGRDDLGPDLRLRDLGSHPLRDIAEETQLYQIVVPGLPVAFPPLVTERLLHRRVPLPPVTLFGRERELEEIDALLRDRSARLVTLLGPGGVGKTSLALALGRQFFDAFPDGVHFVDLSALGDGALVVPAIASVLEIEDPLLFPEDALISRLQHRSLLLMLDNCEQVAGAVAAIVQRLIAETDGVIVLTTSRIPLQLRGEHEMRIEPLPTPRATENPAHNPAVQLFAEQARQVNNRFTLNESAQPAVVEICRLLDGLPLAIELAAAWIRILDPATLHARLADGAPLLRSDTRDRPERHRTLTSTIDWSYRLLSPEAQWAFGRLSVFEGGIPFDSALAVLQDGGHGSFVEALELLDALVQANLLQAPEQTADGPRYGMLQTIREFGLSVLSSEERLMASRAHAMYFAAMASAAEEKYRGPEAVAWLDRLDANLDNLRAATRLLATARTGDPEASLRMATALWEFLDTRNHLHDARSLLMLAIDASPCASARSRARALAQLGNTWLSNYEQAETYFQASLALTPDIPGEDWTMSAAIGLGSIALLRGNYELSLSVACNVLDRSRASGDPAAIAQALLVLGSALEYAGQPNEALLALEESSDISDQIGDLAGRAWARRLQAAALMTLGDIHQSWSLLQQAIAEFEDVGERIMVALCQLDLMRVQLQTDEPPALTQVAAAIEEFVTIADPFTASSMLDTVAAVLVRFGDPETALELLGATERWRKSTGTVLSITLQQETAAIRSTALVMLDPLVASNALDRGYTRSLRDALAILMERLQRTTETTSRPSLPTIA